MPATKLEEVDKGTTSDSFSATYADDPHLVLASFEESLTKHGMETCGTRTDREGTFYRFFLKGDDLWAFTASRYEDERSSVSLFKKDLTRGFGNDFIESGCRPASMPPEARKRIEELEAWEAGAPEREQKAKAFEEIEKARREGHLPF